MRFFLSHVLLVVASVCCVDATAKPTSFLENFKVVLDNSPKNARLVNNMKSNSSFMPGSDSDIDAKALMKKFQTEAGNFIGKVQAEAKGLMNNFHHFSKLEIGLYTALAVSLTVALKSKYTRIPTKRSSN
jgi:hypothetical protein